MGILVDAIELAEERKIAVLGGVDEPGVAFTTESQTRALLLGTDVDFDEFRYISANAGTFFAKAALAVPLPDACRAAWGDGLLVGYMLHAQQG